ncbi:MAG: glycosyltransferase [bacterium]
MISKANQSASKKRTKNPTPTIEEFIALGRNYMEASDFVNFEKTHAKALKFYPNEPELNYQAGFVRLYNKQEDDALEPFLKAWASDDNKERNARALLILRDYFLCKADWLKRRRGLPTTNLQIKQARQSAKIIKETLEASGLTVNDNEPVGGSLSLCMIVKNEERFLAQCLDSVKGLVDEIVLVDTGSTDKTVEIANKYGAKVFYSDWTNDFSAARNVSLSHATCDWVLVLDADEALDIGSFPIIEEAISRPQFGGYLTSILSYLNANNKNDVFTHPTVRLFRRLSCAKFVGSIHEQVMASINEPGHQIGFLYGTSILHYGYEKTISAERKKNERAIEMLEKEVKKNPDNLFQIFNLANTYYCDKQYVKAIEILSKKAELIPLDWSIAPATYHIWAAALVELHREEEALKVADMASKFSLGMPPLLYLRALSLLRLERYEDALKQIRLIRETNWTSEAVGDLTVMTYKADAVEGQALVELKRYDEAEPILLKAYKQAPDYPAIPYALGKLYGIKGRLDKADKLLRSAAANSEYAAPALSTLADCYIEQGLKSKAAAVWGEICDILPNDISFWQKWNSLAEEAQDHFQIVLSYQWLSSHGPMISTHYVNWGRALVALGQFEEALQKYKVAIEANPDANAFFNAGDLLYHLGAYNEAYNTYQIGLEMDSKCTEGWFMLGNSLLQMQIYDAARVAFKQVLTLSPNHEATIDTLDLLEEATKQAVS